MKWNIALLTAVLSAAGCRSTEPAPPDPVVAPARYSIQFKDNKALSSRTLRGTIVDELADFNRVGPTRAGADDAAYLVEEHYRSLGFHEALVDYTYRDVPGGQTEIAFNVVEGPRAVIGDLRILGMKAYPADELAKLFSGPREGLLGTGRLYYVKSRVQAGAGSIESFYYGEGYLKARVQEPTVELDKSRKVATVTVNISEGPRYRLRSIDFEGDPILPVERLTKATSAAVGAPYVPRVAYSLRAKLLELFGREGYPDSEVEFKEARDAETGDVRLVYALSPGEQVTIRELRFSGLERTRTGFLERRIELEVGDRYDTEKVRKSFRNLYRTGLFERVQIELVEGEGTERALAVTVVEAPTIETFLEPGYGSYEGPRLRLGAEHKNIFGTGRRLSGESSVSPKAWGAEVSLTDPWLFESKFVGSVSTFIKEREEPSFTVAEVGTSVSVTRDWTRVYGSALKYSLRATELEDVDVNAAEAQDALENVDISSITLASTRDTRNREDIFWPDDGSRVRLSVEWADSALGSDVDFVRSQLNHTQYFPLAERTVLALALRGGIIQPISGTDVIPIQERFFNGGENSVRSFNESELGVLDADGDPLGGEGFTLLSAELRQRLTGNFSGALFYDTGNVVADYTDYLDFDDFRAGIGLGLRYMLPIGPLRLDGGFNPNPGDEEDSFVLHFSVGMSF